MASLGLVQSSWEDTQLWRIYSLAGPLSQALSTHPRKKGTFQPPVLVSALYCNVCLLPLVHLQAVWLHHLCALPSRHWRQPEELPFTFMYPSCTNALLAASPATCPSHMPSWPQWPLLDLLHGLGVCPELDLGSPDWTCPLIMLNSRRLPSLHFFRHLRSLWRAAPSSSVSTTPQVWEHLQACWQHALCHHPGHHQTVTA